MCRLRTERSFRQTTKNDGPPHCITIMRVREIFMIELKINGSKKQFDGDPDMPLLWYLRDGLEMTGTKFGCGIGQCGACTVMVNGQATRACQTQMKAAAAKEITTIEGLA